MSNVIVNAPVSTESLRKNVAEALEPYELTVDEFLHSDIDDLENVDLRELWLMVKGVLEPAA